MGSSMLKKLLISLAILAGLAAPVYGAGTVPGFSLTPQFDTTGKVAPGCKLYTIAAGTTSTPQTVYQDTALTIPHPYPVPCDATGRLPQWFAADGQVKLRLTTASGTQIFVGDNLLVIGPSSGGGGGGGGSVDPTTILATGDMKLVYSTGSLTGFVRANGRTIGSASSGATERANADTSALFSFLWNADANLAVSGGRGANAAADFAANKTIALPDSRGRAIAGLDDMGNSAASRLNLSFFGCNTTTLGCAGGSETKTLAAANIPSITSTGSNSLALPAGNYVTAPVGFSSYSANAGSQVWSATSPGNFVGNLNPSASGTVTVTSTGTSGTAFSATQPTILMTIYIKL